MITFLQKIIANPGRWEFKKYLNFFYVLLTMVKIATFLRVTIVNTDMIRDEVDKAVVVIL